MKDTFQWTPELLADFFNSTKILPVDLANGMEQFKSSKAPKKEWEIVALSDNAYGSLVTNENKLKIFTLEEYPSMYQRDRFTIHSVRRLSDSEIFSVGDRILFGENRKAAVTKFSFIDGELGIYYEGGAFNSKVYSDLQKLPSPLFVTTDGVEIYPGMEFWVVGRDFDLSIFNPLKASEAERGAYKDATVFSTREAAETYILENKPLLSLNDVKEAAKNENWHTAMIERLTALVKQKLNP